MRFRSQWGSEGLWYKFAMLSRGCSLMPRPGEKTRVLAEGSTATGYDGIRLGINIFDLGRINSSMLGMLGLAEKIDHVPIRFDLSRLDEGGVAFSCPLLDAACLC